MPLGILERLFAPGWRRFCPVCGCSCRSFRPYGRPRRPQARCPSCGSLERHRLLWLFLTAHSDLFDGRPKSVLHLAPEACLEQQLSRRLGRGYLTADLFQPAMIRMDLCSVPFPDGHFDAVLCSHVLEHVSDDRRAMGEIRRVLKTSGWAVLQVPITGEKTVEDPTVTTPQERERRFGQADHLRAYGLDFPERLQQAGFRVRTITIQELVGEQEMLHFGLGPAAGEIFFCTRE